MNRGVRVPRRVLVVTVVALAITGALASPVRAATSRITVAAGKGSCPVGYVCLWLLGAFNGTGYGFYNSESNYASLPYPFSLTNDNTWSFYNNGLAGAVDDVRFYRESGLSGDQFVLCRGDAISDLPPNGNLPQITWYPGRGWRDAISSHKWGDYC